METGSANCKHRKSGSHNPVSSYGLRLTDLGFAFGDVVDPRSPEEEVTLLP